MGLIIVCSVMSVVITFLIFTTYKFSMALIRCKVLENKALNLLKQSKSIDTVTSKHDRAIESVRFQIERDKLLDRSESLLNKLTEIN